MLFKILSLIYDVVIFTAMSYSIYLWLKKGYTHKQRFMFVYLIAVFFVDVLGIYIRQAYQIDQFYLYMPFNVLSIVYFSYFFGIDYQNNINKYFLYGVSFLTLLVITYIQVETPIIKIDAQIFVALVLFFLLISLQWLLYIINHIDEENITHKQAFWVSVALIIWSVFALFRLFLNQWLYDYDRDIVRNYIFISLLSSFDVSYENVIVDNELMDYLKIPQNNKCFYDFIYKNVKIIDNSEEKIINFAAQYTEVVQDGQLKFVARIIKIDDLQDFIGHLEYDCKNGLFTSKGKHFPIIEEKADFFINNLTEFNNGVKII